jgi:cell division protein FtsI/penicillin-binding protein 2
MNFKVVLGILIIVAFFALGGLRLIGKAITQTKSFAKDAKNTLNPSNSVTIEEKRAQAVQGSIA